MFQMRPFKKKKKTMLFELSNSKKIIMPVPHTSSKLLIGIILQAGE